MIENAFDVPFVARLAQREKQIQQHYRPVIGVHKWFARRPGALFRTLILSEFDEGEPVHKSYFDSHNLREITVADPFMGGGTPLFEANRLGCDVLGTDINPMAYWIVRQELAPFDVDVFLQKAARVVEKVEAEIGDFYRTQCEHCGSEVQVKYFLWVKTIPCEQCEEKVDLFSKHLVAKNQRHPNYVLFCSSCHSLNEVESLDNEDELVCGACSARLQVEGPAGRSRCTCQHCGHVNQYPAGNSPPHHRMYAMEYHCERCYGNHQGRFFKAPDEADRRRFHEAEQRLTQSEKQFIPDETIPSGDESSRLHRWGYECYRELFNARQLLGLNTLASAIHEVQDDVVREALLTVFSDSLRYQNMLCRYDTYALKIQDIFSVHGFPVGLAQCENSVLGVPGKGSGGFRHFLKKYKRAKTYCQQPYEYTLTTPKQKVQTGETIEACITEGSPLGANSSPEKQAYLHALPARAVDVPEESLDAVFTDPPYFGNVQYAELMDFCYVWLRRHFDDSSSEFVEASTRADEELTVNKTAGRDIAHFTEGLSLAYQRFASGLKEGSPFVFTYHHNEIEAYLPIAVAILDAELVCTATLPCPAEMGASIHISGTKSSTLDTIFVNRRSGRVRASDFEASRASLKRLVKRDLVALKNADMELTSGDAYCLLLGHVSRLAIWQARKQWDTEASASDKISRMRNTFEEVFPSHHLSKLSDQILASTQEQKNLGPLFSAESQTAFETGQWIEFGTHPASA